MKTFLKIALIIFAALVAIKLLPLTLAAGCIIGGAAVIALVVGVSAAAVLLCVAAALIAVLSPIWLPVVAVLGVVSLCRKRHPANSTTAPAA